MTSANASEANVSLEPQGVPRSPDDARETVENRYLSRIQFRHAAIMTTGLPLAGSVAAVILAFRWGVGLFEIAALAVMYVLTVIGLEVGYHRLFAHRAFKTNPAVRAVLGALGCMCGQGPLVYWAATHRCHHQHSDHDGDPHSPHLHGQGWRAALGGFWHAYVGWTFRHATPNTAHYAKDLLKDPVARTVNRFYYLWIALGLALPALAGFLALGSRGALLGLLWGGLLRMLLVTQAALSVTSLCHIIGSRPFRTSERSRNTLLLTIPTFGQAWHNHHHAFPTAAYVGFKWWQVDLGGWVIRLLSWAGLAWDAKKPKRQELDALRADSDRA